MDLLKRYLAGEREPVWRDLRSLGPAARDAAHADDAWAVACETMRRVRRNCERLAERLERAGYVSGIYPDGERAAGSEDCLAGPSDEMDAQVAEIETRIGPVPLSLRAFWHELGAVDFIGMGPSWPAALDPLVIAPPSLVLIDYDDWEVDRAEGWALAADGFEAGLAPDALTKDNVSGGPAYAVALPDPSADFVLRHEPHGLFFVDYLRLAILRWGGLPGLDGRGVPFPLLDELTAGLEPF